MVNQIYPRVEINLQYLKENVKEMVRRCEEKNIEVAGVIKGTTGLVKCAKQFEEGGCKMIASSRLEQIEDAKEAGINLPYMLLRVPMPREISEVVRLTDISLNSEISVLKALNREAEKQNKIHQVILMADLGDLREGFWDKNEMVDAAMLVESDLRNLELSGVGTNLGCYGSILATQEKLDELVVIAENIEKKIGRKLQYISGGATSSLMRVIDGDIPERINLLRCGEGILLARDLELFYGYNMDFMHHDVYKLKAEVIEVKLKPSHPVGEIAVDAFGHKPEYVDRGMRKRALLGIGKVDYGDISEIFPVEEGITVLGASSDHTILDVEDYKYDIKPGDIVTFDINYASMVYLTNCRNVQIVYV